MSYLLEASAYLIAFYLLYYVGLRRDTFFERNRVYLLLSALVAVLLPWFELPADLVIANLPRPDWPPVLASITSSDAISVESSFSLIDLIHYGYYTVVIGLSIRFIYQLVQLGRIIYHHRVTVHPGYRVVHTNGQVPLSSFFCFIFWNDALQHQVGTSALLLKHELQHVRGKHTYDLLALRLLKIVLWFNPIVYFYYRSLQTQHEFIADRAVITHTSASRYQQLLVNHLFHKLSVPLTHRFNRVHLKARIAMMNRPRTSRPHLLTPLLAIPMAIGLLLLYNPGAAQLAFHSMKETPINTLYLHCGNPLALDLSDAVGEVSYDIQGGELVLGEQLHQVVIIPNQSEVALRVTDGDTQLKEYHFRVRRVPLPGIILRHDTISSVNNIRITPSQATTLSVHAVPDEDLGRFLPRDARFKLLGTVSLVRNGQTLRTIPLDGSFDSKALDEAQSDDEIVVSVEKLLRMNFQGEVKEIGLETARVLKANII